MGNNKADDSLTDRNEAKEPVTDPPASEAEGEIWSPWLDRKKRAIGQPSEDDDDSLLALFLGFSS